jgi:glycosyltransferase involved in cell wall biosynthesis
LKILSVIEAFGHGGAQTVLLDVVLSLTEHQHRVVHYSSANAIAPDETFVRILRAAGIDCLDVHWDSLQNEYLRSNILDGFHPDVVLFHWWGKDPWMPWVLARSPGKPTFVCVLHHSGIPVKAGYDRYVLVSQSQLPQVNHIPPDQIRVIPNGIDLKRFPSQVGGPDQSTGVHDRRFVIGRLSELREGKIPAGWVQTLASFRLENTRFVIAGDGTLLPILRKSATDLGVEDKVSFPGYISREKVPSLLGTFDVFCYVTSSAVECCPLAVLEAMAAHVPIVAEARGGIPELVVDGESGLLANSIAEIGAHLCRLRDDPELRARLGRGARATAERFSVARQVAAYQDLLAGP